MESRLIFESSKLVIITVQWNHKGTVNEWQSIPSTNQTEFINYLIKDYLKEDNLQLVISRHDSISTSIQDLIARFLELLFLSEFIIWNNNFTKAIQINIEGDYRLGKAIV